MIELHERYTVQKKLEEFKESSRESLVNAILEFIRQYTDSSGKKVYMEAIVRMLTESGKKSLEVDYLHLNSFIPDVAQELLENPRATIDAAEEALKRILTDEFGMENPDDSWHGRFYNIGPSTLPSRILTTHLNRFIEAEAVVSRVTEVKSFIAEAVFVCKAAVR